MQIQHIATRSLARARHLRARHLDFENRPDTLVDLLAAALVLLVFLMAAILV